MEPVEESKRFGTEIADAVGATERRRMEEDSGSSAKAGIAFWQEVLVVGGKVFSDRDGERSGESGRQSVGLEDCHSGGAWCGESGGGEVEFGGEG